MGILSGLQGLKPVSSAMLPMTPVAALLQGAVLKKGRDDGCPRHRHRRLYNLEACVNTNPHRMWTACYSYYNPDRFKEFLMTCIPDRHFSRAQAGFPFIAQNHAAAS
jgi:hypothetical protein